MRRKTLPGRTARRRAIVYTCALVALVAYGLPRIPALQHGLGGSFSVIWILFAGLAIAANLYFVVGADRERSRILEERELFTSRSAASPVRRERGRA
ncbi:hypothetical protein JI721_03395 [Alicyclobacillus cycloheptanicus]|uniref:DUF485 domain-containing protein n=1 Tax=Alicyclobacillus cycloheptanicus TaxID=1457 RepID=A0ABT9XMF0_9BACL|nr:hypothetical protein [Alicyclobacillus cycloheptanicus]MDQ0191496.1 hypothetical protein [Alicyclobacillus cycloheptanicus]WDM01901.1 hypothetical protein JI721_03395 [Alicyclobacillus cycloheptanicus]